MLRAICPSGFRRTSTRIDRHVHGCPDRCRFVAAHRDRQVKVPPHLAECVLAVRVRCRAPAVVRPIQDLHPRTDNRRALGRLGHDPRQGTRESDSSAASRVRLPYRASMRRVVARYPFFETFSSNHPAPAAMLYRPASSVVAVLPGPGLPKTSTWAPLMGKPEAPSESTSRTTPLTLNEDPGGPGCIGDPPRAAGGRRERDDDCGKRDGRAQDHDGHLAGGKPYDRKARGGSVSSAMRARRPALSHGALPTYVSFGLARIRRIQTG